MSLPTINNPRIKFVKKASRWVKTYFTFDVKGLPKQVQEWFDTEAEAKAVDIAEA
jgi:hypothetical protein